jgi:hypothetical protein
VKTASPEKIMPFKHEQRGIASIRNDTAVAGAWFGAIGTGAGKSSRKATTTQATTTQATTMVSLIDKAMLRHKPIGACSRTRWTLLAAERGGFVRHSTRW